MRLEISGGPLVVKFRIQGHLGVVKSEKHPLGQNCPKADPTIKILKYPKRTRPEMNMRESIGLKR